MNCSLKRFNEGGWCIVVFIALLFVGGCVSTPFVAKNEEDTEESLVNKEEIAIAESPHLPAPSAPEEERKAGILEPEVEESEPEEEIEAFHKPEPEKEEKPAQKPETVTQEVEKKGGRIVSLDFREEELRDVLKVFSALLKMTESLKVRRML